MKFSLFLSSSVLLFAAKSYAQNSGELIPEYPEPEAPFQSSFDLHRSFHVGLIDRLSADPFQNKLTIETGAMFEHNDIRDQEAKSHRFRFLESRLSFVNGELELEGRLFAFHKGKRQKEPAFWMTTFFGEPARHDIHANISHGFAVGRIHYRPIDGVSNWQVDVGQYDLNLAVFQSQNMADYLQIRLGGGGGFNAFKNKSGVPNVYPEAGIVGRYRLDKRGLGEIGLSARARFVFEKFYPRSR